MYKIDKILFNKQDNVHKKLFKLQLDTITNVNPLNSSKILFKNALVK